jgi:uncharacterized protein (TIGR02646 family)
MKYIKKAGCPHAYSQWCAAVAGTDKSDWREIPADQKGLLLGALLAEQGGLCAYTMRRIDRDTSHVEHIKPQSRCRADLSGSDLDYSNLVACFPREGMNKAYRYGAQNKESWWENDGAEFVSPLQPTCERRFRFGLDGKINAANNHASALMTIEVLALDHNTLTEDRRRVIEEFIYGPAGDDPLSPAQAQRLRQTVCNPRAGGLFYEFCIAIRDGVEEHLRSLRKSAERRKAIRRRN